MEQEQPESSNAVQSDGVLDRTVALLKKFNLYLLTLATVVGSWYALHDVAKVESQYIYLLVSVPFLLLVLLEILPNWYKKRQIDKLIELGITGTVAHADYFRLQPYEAVDYGRFQRADQAHEKILL